MEKACQRRQCLAELELYFPIYISLTFVSVIDIKLEKPQEQPVSEGGCSC